MIQESVKGGIVISAAPVEETKEPTTDEDLSMTLEFV